MTTRINEIIKGLKVIQVGINTWAVTGVHPNLGGNDYSMINFNTEEEAKERYWKIILLLQEEGKA